MAKLRSALALASLEQYVGLAINFALIATLSRLLSPAEIGIAAVATGISTVVFSMREFVTAEFLIQQTEVSEHDTRTAYTMSFLVSALLAMSLCLAAPTLARFYGHEEIGLFLIMTTVALVIESVSYPIVSLLRRDMAFGKLALIRTSSATTAAAASVSLALAGFGLMSIAIGGLFGALVTTASAVCVRPQTHLVRPSLASWRAVLEFGRYRGAAMAVQRVYEALPQLVIGRVLPMSSVGLYNRANTLCAIPDRILLSSVLSVAYPALAAALREGQDIKAAYLKALAYITAFYWPAFVLMAMLADPIVRVVLGPNWAAAIPLVQIISLASLFWFPAVLTYPVLAAVGANRDAFLATAIGRGTAAVVLCSASFFGLMAMALSQFINLSLQMMVSFWFVRRHVPFGVRELMSALAPSFVVTATSMAGPIALLAANDFRFEHSVGMSLVNALVAAAGWYAGLGISRHPVLGELTRLARRLAALGHARLSPKAAATVGPAQSGTS